MIVKKDGRGRAVLSKRRLPEDNLRADKATRMLNKLVRMTDFEMMNG